MRLQIPFHTILQIRTINSHGMPEGVERSQRHHRRPNVGWRRVGGGGGLGARYAAGGWIYMSPISLRLQLVCWLWACPHISLHLVTDDASAPVPLYLAHGHQSVVTLQCWSPNSLFSPVDVWLKSKCASMQDIMDEFI